MKISNSLFISVALAFVIALTPSFSADAQAAMSISPTSVTLNVGDTTSVSVTGGTSPYYMGSNTRTDVASALLNGSNITVNALSQGTDSISVCSYVNSTVSCASFLVTVNKPTNTTPTQSQATISFSQNNVSVNIGESKSVTVNGSGAGAYYINTNNTDFNASSAGISGNTVTLTGMTVGGSNVTVCQFGGTCGNIYTFVPNTSANTTAVTTVQTQATTPMLSAFYVASNNQGGGFLGKGATLTFKFNTTSDITSNSFKVNGQQVIFTGTGSGPYGGTYVMTGNEPMPLPISISFSTATGLTGHSSFAMGDQAVAVPVTDTSSASGASGAVFTRALLSGSTGSDVSALQRLLAKLGLYSGPVTGNYGPLTMAAVKKYQTKKGLDALGSVGPGTRAALNKEI